MPAAVPIPVPSTPRTRGALAVVTAFGPRRRATYDGSPGDEVQIWGTPDGVTYAPVRGGFLRADEAGNAACLVGDVCSGYEAELLAGTGTGTLTISGAARTGNHSASPLEVPSVEGATGAPVDLTLAGEIASVAYAGEAGDVAELQGAPGLSGPWAVLHVFQGDAAPEIHTLTDGIGALRIRRVAGTTPATAAVSHLGPPERRWEHAFLVPGGAIAASTPHQVYTNTTGAEVAISGICLLPQAAHAAQDVNAVRYQLGSVGAIDTQTAGAGGTGSWVAGTPLTIEGTATLAPGDSLELGVSPLGSGDTVPDTLLQFTVSQSL